MKLAFTTLGCPNWDLDTIITKARAYNYDGVDFRGLLGTMEIYMLEEFTTDLQTTVQKFRDANLEVPCFSSSIRLFAPTKEEQDEFMEELKAYGELAQAFNTPYIRVFGGEIGQTSREEAFQVVEEHLAKLLPIAEAYDVQLLLETHDDWTTCDLVKEVIDRANSPHLEALWDVHHPYRTEGEEPEQTLATLKDHIHYTHWKDSNVSEQSKRGFELCLLGEGDIPLKRIFQLLMDHGYDGYYTLEWEKVWEPDIEEPEVAFKHYAEFMRRLSE